MNLFGLNISVTRSTTPTLQRSLSPAAAAWLAGRDTETVRVRLDNPFHRVAWLYRAATVLAEQIANIPFLFSRGERGREHLITGGPLHDFYNQPHPHINRFQYWELRVLWLLLRGECFRVPIYDETFSASTSSNPSLTGSGLGKPLGQGGGERQISNGTSSKPADPRAVLQLLKDFNGLLDRVIPRKPQKPNNEL